MAKNFIFNNKLKTKNYILNKLKTLLLKKDLKFKSLRFKGYIYNKFNFIKLIIIINL